ncbi:hypothetical protein [Virgibacillus profundi]|uniref:hypothetical protein n=1 Tax=Virgibacillus profundi TaxID=2024555 RepID=UPI0013FE31F9|nr:hypothetical protein [Virgibacillus profundi]
MSKQYYVSIVRDHDGGWRLIMDGLCIHTFYRKSNVKAFVVEMIDTNKNVEFVIEADD